MPPVIPTITTNTRIAPFDRLMLWLALLQGSSFMLTIALHAPLPIPVSTAATLVSALWAAMYLFATIGLFSAFGVNWMTWLVRYRLLLTLLVTATAFSAFWSIDPRLSTERALHLVGTTLIALHIGFRLPLSTIIRETARVFALLLCLSLLAALHLPEVGLEGYEGRLVWRGVMASKNTLGFWASVSVLLFLTRLTMVTDLLARAGWVVMTLLALVCLAASVSATSALSLVVALLVMAYLHAATSLRLGILSMLVLGILVATLTALAFQSIDTAELIGRSGDLTGRMQVWEETWRLIRERPLGGFGYGSLWFPTEASLSIQQSLTDLSWTVYHAHNGLLHVASEIGIPLTVLLLLMITQQLVETVWCQYHRPQTGILFVVGFCVALLVSNYSEARLLINRDLFWIFLVALPISMVQQMELVADAASPFPAPLPGRRRGRASPSVRRAHRVRRRDLKRRLQVRFPSKAREPVVSNEPWPMDTVDGDHDDRSHAHADGAARAQAAADDARRPGSLERLPRKAQ